MLSSVLGPAVTPQVTFLGSQQGLTSIALISDSGSNQRFSFALTTLPTASTVVVAHMSSLFTLNKEKQKLFSAEHSACGRGYLQCGPWWRSALFTVAAR